MHRHLLCPEELRFAAMLLFAQHTSPRLQHMAQWLGNYLFGHPLTIVTRPEALTAAEVVFNYSQLSFPFIAFQIIPHTLLFQTGIAPQAIEVQWEKEIPFFFPAGGHFPYDVLAASFYLMQRYEEYLPHRKDMYGRYAHTNSLAFQHRFLHLPVIDVWMQQLKGALVLLFPQLTFTQRQFQFLPTYDVDIAYSYKGKGWRRNGGGLLRSVLQLQFAAFIQRLLVLTGNKQDPFDVFEELGILHRQHGLQPIYFFLLSQKQRGIDKNISPNKVVYRSLIKRISGQYKTGIHLSAAASASFKTMCAEKELLTAISGHPVAANRMHYLLFHLPETYRELQQEPLRITQEFSMGYGSINGFRAGTCTPYFWYDVMAEKSTSLQVFPFCYMEANAVFEQKDSPEAALEEMKEFYKVIKQAEGMYITVFHNHLIGRSAEGRRWMKMYTRFLSFLSA